ncbi:hypothetical protein OESDEN_14495 [Oesophagostomum dentatum]|uniref:Uncharacterized protein n=1 Tax=Oesophagostomum dentatum TaxID=61180 RepID=A0A0B1SRE8_OESDE|nr:hypothetical protein OESDEN_14495 [Oesophagostomum dentatum]
MRCPGLAGASSSSCTSAWKSELRRYACSHQIRASDGA